jgi:D-serine deaminase-like pyridoxal phosphate-dependent protein
LSEDDEASGQFDVALWILEPFVRPHSTSAASTEPGRMMITPPTNVRVPPSQGVASATPNHVCSAVNLVDELVAVRADEIVDPLVRRRPRSQHLTTDVR